MAFRIRIGSDLAASLGVLAAAAAASLLEAPLGPAAAAAIAFAVGAYSAFFHRPPVARAFAAAAVLALGAGLLLGGSPQPLALWLIDATAIVLLAELLGSASQRLRKTAITDPLTGLLNREGLWDVAARSIAICRRLERPITVVHIDLDHFKAINDGWGHGEGDRVLKLCVARWLAAIRSQDTLARFGGDEFVLMLPGSDLGAAERLLERLRRRSPAHWSHGSAELLPGEDLEACLRRADTALYAAKAQRPRSGSAVAERAHPPGRSWRRTDPRRLPAMTPVEPLASQEKSPPSDV